MVQLPPESPSWADDTLAVCGFTRRGVVVPSVVEVRSQVHGAQIHRVELSEELPLGAEPPDEGDGLWTSSPGLVVGVRVADCVPILLYDPEVPAVAAVHAGWRGTVAGITEAAVAMGHRQLGVSVPRLRAAIGPAIGPCCFEVGVEVVDGLRELGLSDEEFGRVQGPSGRPHVDLRAANRHLLERAGLKPEHIEVVGGCTFCSGGGYESFRRDGARSGRMHAVIGLALLVLALVLPACGSPKPPGIEMVSAMKEVSTALLGGDGPAAERLLGEILEQHPDDALANAEMARALHLQGRDSEAVVAGRVALGLAPKLWQAAYNLACHHTALRQHDAAIRWLQQALLLSDIAVDEVVADLDLLPLRDDHRFAFYENSGVLSRAEQDVIVRVDAGVVRVGEPVTLSLLVVALNRPLLSPRLAVSLEALSDWPAGLVSSRARSESFSAGESGGREYSQRTFQFTFVPRQEGFVALGPFRVQQGEQVHYTGATILEVRPRSEGAPVSPIPEFELSAREFFAAPSQVDTEFALGLPSDSVRFERFRAPAADTLPSGVTLALSPTFRSVFLQRGSEGLSHLLELD